ncbi:zinc-binding dehydrogenase, partial [Streptomyces sp. NPDC059466]|uniref:zinc-binding dehydrogenase n=1 Tax=Streptomyces sp. NPDC059466 TaxID=3346843 RepID=UPI003673C214
VMGELVAADRAPGGSLIDSSHVRPVVDRELPMSEAAAAHRILEESGHIGKVLLVAP